MSSLLKLKEAREILNISEPTMYTIIYNREKNKFPALKIGGSWRVPKEALEKWISENTEVKY